MVVRPGRMTVEAWPFLIGRSKNRGYRLVVAPAFLQGKDALAALRASIRASATPPGTALLRELELADGKVSVVCRIFTARLSDFGLGGDELLTDDLGRRIELTEGLVLRCDQRTSEGLGIAPADLQRAHDRVTEPFRQFWLETGAFKIRAADPIPVGKPGAGSALSQAPGSGPVPEPDHQTIPRPRPRPERKPGVGQKPVARRAPGADRVPGAGRSASGPRRQRRGVQLTAWAAGGGVAASAAIIAVSAGIFQAPAISASATLPTPSASSAPSWPSRSEPSLSSVSSSSQQPRLSAASSRAVQVPASGPDFQFQHYGRLTMTAGIHYSLGSLSPSWGAARTAGPARDIEYLQEHGPHRSQLLVAGAVAFLPGPARLVVPHTACRQATFPALPGTRLVPSGPDSARIGPSGRATGHSGGPTGHSGGATGQPGRTTVLAGQEITAGRAFCVRTAPAPHSAPGGYLALVEIKAQKKHTLSLVLYVWQAEAPTSAPSTAPGPNRAP